MLIAEPPRTAYDLNFQVLGFPVRVHPFFWLAGLLLGFSAFGQRPMELLIWFVALFVSILVHELGHALMMRRFRRPAHIVLYHMGGLAIEGQPRGGDFGSPWSFDSYVPYQPRPRIPAEQILISAAGPGIQLLLAAGVIAIVYATGGSIEFDYSHFLPLPSPVFSRAMADNHNLALLLAIMIDINILWALMNLLPVLPLDGGQIAMQVFVQQDPWGGMVRALWVSVITGGAVAVLALFHDQYMMILFAMLAASNYLTLQQISGRRPW